MTIGCRVDSSVSSRGRCDSEVPNAANRICFQLFCGWVLPNRAAKIFGEIQQTDCLCVRGMRMSWRLMNSQDFQHRVSQNAVNKIVGMLIAPD